MFFGGRGASQLLNYPIRCIFTRIRGSRGIILVIYLLFPCSFTLIELYIRVESILEENILKLYYKINTKFCLWHKRNKKYAFGACLTHFTSFVDIIFFFASHLQIAQICALFISQESSTHNLYFAEKPFQNTKLIRKSQ